MANRQSRPFPMLGVDQYDPSFGMYENTYPPQFPGSPGHPTHFDSVAFWYRSEPQEPVFNHNSMLYNHPLPVPNSPLEQQASIKHRRTRSGCFTCRQRRVKCDETRPICERCKKGNRECQFPQPSSLSRRVDANDTRGTHGKSSQSSKTDESKPLYTIDDGSGDEKERSVSPAQEPSPIGTDKSHIQTSKAAEVKRRLRRKSNPVEVKEADSPRSQGTTSPDSHTDTPVSVSNTNTPPTDQRLLTKALRWKHLNTSMQQYLQFHLEHVTRHHYFLKLDPNDFIHNEFIDMALSFEPLLYAVVGFAAYHHTLGKSSGKFQEFWRYYCQSIMLLRKWLESNSDRNEAVLLTVLQLATFEEYLGDWASLASHQKAAYSIFSTLYTFENIMSSEASRCIFDWLARADVAVSLMGGTSSVLEREWFTIALQWHQDQVDSDALDATTALPCFVAKLRLIGFDMAAVFANAASNPHAMQNILNISKRMDALRLEIQRLHNTTYTVRTVLANDKTRNIPEEAFDPHIPLFRGHLWPLNFLWVDWYATEQMHKYQTALFMQAVNARTQARKGQPPHRSSHQNPNLNLLPPELEKLSLIQCQIFEAIEQHPRAPAGAILSCQASLALSSVFLKKEPKYIMWARRKLANVERMGYIWPPSFRKRMAQLWNDESLLDWWLPNDEHKIDLLDEIRGVVEERNREIEVRGGDERDDVREIKAVFEKLDFGSPVGRTRKDSVWSAAGAEADKSTKMSRTPDDSDSSGEDDDSDEDEDDEQQGSAAQQNWRGNRDSGVDAGALFVADTRRGQAPTTTLEYSNRMSGIWEGPCQGQQ